MNKALIMHLAHDKILRLILQRNTKGGVRNAKCPARGRASHLSECNEVLRSLKVTGRAAARALVGHDLEGDLLAFLQRAQSSALDGRDMDEDVLAAVVGLNETVALLLVEPLHSTRIHGMSSS